MCDPQRERNKESKQVRNRDELISTTNREHRARNGPRDRERVELLHILSRPNVGALDGLEDVELVLHDAQHHNVVEQGADDAADGLEGEGGFGGKLDVLCQLEVAQEQDALGLAVVGEQGKVHVRQRTAWEKVTGQHLRDGLEVEPESGQGVLGPEE